MIVEGERVRALVGSARSEVLLCSPFIKAKAFSVVLEAIPPNISVRIVTRWRPEEIAAGFSDLEVFDIANERANTQLFLLHTLHAKLYLADDDCLVGSANLTAAALGWKPDSNIEILLATNRSDSDVSVLLQRVANATPATFQIRNEMEKLASGFDTPEFIESQDVPPEFTERAVSPWLPRCAAPTRLYEIYQNTETLIVTEGTRADAIADLQDLAPPPRLDQREFSAHISCALFKLPSLQSVLTRIPASMTDSQGVDIIRELRQDLSKADAQKQWSIVREWIAVFFKDRFEVAPQSYVVRLKPR